MADATPRPRKKRRVVHTQPRAQKRKRDEDDLTALAAKVAALDPQDGTLTTFEALPLSKPTASGLHSAHFITLTAIQRQAIPRVLQGADVLGAAKTGSGKTLAFLVPVLENLYRKRWTEHDGLGALILSPTRELAIQIFEVLRKVGRYHTFSAGLVIGGKNLQEERERLTRMNILVCTPGRMLQHLDQTAMFECHDLQMLVLDEADRILDMGFQNTVDAIIEHLPKERQTLLFSATQTKKVADLARLSLRDPDYVSVHQAAPSATPAKLQQHYVVVPLPDKLDTLWSFLRTNVKAKTLVFLSSGKQVRFVYESFRQLQPGVPLLHLHGRQKQTARLDIVTRFASAKYSCLFATDVVARGLDFPAVDWVIQLDCPEDAETYIHRVGRTARFEKEGRAVLLIEPSEQEGMLKRLFHKKVPIEEIRIKSKKQQSIKNQLQNMCFRDPELKYLGQKAFISYAKSVHVQKDKKVFDVQALPLEEYAASLGLPGTPHIKFQKGDDAKARKNASRALLSSEDEGEKPPVRTKYDRMFERVNQDVLAPHYTSMLEESRPGRNNDDSETEFLTVKRRLSIGSSNSEASIDNRPPSTETQTPAALDLRSNGEPLVIDSHRREKLLKSKKALLKFKDRGHKMVFDDDGRAHEVYEMQDEAGFHAEGAPDAQRRKFVAAEQAALSQRDAVDKQAQRDKRRTKIAKRKERERAEGEQLDGEQAVAELEGLDDAEEIGMDLDQLDWSNDDEGEGEAEEETAPWTDGAKTKEKKAKKEGKKEKKKKKWFQSSSEDEDDEPGTTSSKNKRKKKGKSAISGPAEVETLEDLEELAASYM